MRLEAMNEEHLSASVHSSISLTGKSKLSLNKGAECDHKQYDLF